MSEIRRKLVIVGDGACGKVCFPLVDYRARKCNLCVQRETDNDLDGAQTCLLIVFSKGTFPEVRPSWHVSRRTFLIDDSSLPPVLCNHGLLLF